MSKRGAIVGVVLFAILAGTACRRSSSSPKATPADPLNAANTADGENPGHAERPETLKQGRVDGPEDCAQAHAACTARITALEREHRIALQSLSDTTRLAPLVSTFAICVSDDQVQLADATIHAIPEGDARRTRIALARYLRGHPRPPHKSTLELSSIRPVAFDLLPLEVGANLWTLTSTAMAPPDAPEAWRPLPATRIRSIEISERSISLGLESTPTLWQTVTPRGTRYAFFSLVPLPPQRWLRVVSDNDAQQAAEAAFQSFLASPEGRTQYAHVPRNAPLDLTLTHFVHPEGESLLAQLNLGSLGDDDPNAIADGVQNRPRTASANGEAGWLTIAFRRRASTTSESEVAAWREVGMLEDSGALDVLGDIDGDGAPEIVCISDADGKDAEASVSRIFPTVETLFTTDLSQP